MVDAAGTTAYGYLTGGLLYTEDGPFTSDTVTNLYWNGMRTNLSGTFHGAGGIGGLLARSHGYSSGNLER